MRSLQRKITQIEEDMAQLEETVDELEQQMVSPAVLDDHVKLNELNQALDEAHQLQEEKLSEWENLSLDLEEIENNQ